MCEKLTFSFRVMSIDTNLLTLGVNLTTGKNNIASMTLAYTQSLGKKYDYCSEFGVATCNSTEVVDSDCS